MSDDREDLALRWRFIFTSLKKPRRRSLAEVNARLQAILDRSDRPPMTHREIDRMIERHQIERYGRRLSSDEVWDVLKRIADKS